MKSELKPLLVDTLIMALSAFVWGAVFAWVIDDHISNILGRDVAFVDVWVISFMSLIYFSSIVNRGST